MKVWLSLWKSSKAVERFARKDIEDSGVCLSDFAVLELLMHKHRMPVNTIGKKVFLTSGSITSAIDRLEQKGFVERILNSEDRRIKEVCLTQTGKTFIEPVFEKHATSMNKAMKHLSKDEKKILVELLRKVRIKVETDSSENAE
ncbi:MAG: MarR family transcriptional regulator [Leptospirales bacterium]